MAQRTWTPSQESAMNIRNKMMLVSAAAGSGKTSVLTERIIRLLTEPNSQADFSRILVVTFTRAAAAELKSRIGAALTAALAERPSDAHLSRQLFLLGSAQISTIDAFFQKTVRDHFEQLEIPASFRLADQSEATELCLRVLDETLQELYSRYKVDNDSSALFSELQGNRFARAMDDLLSNRHDADFDAKLLTFYEKFSSYPQGIELLKDYAIGLRNSSEQPFFTSIPGKVLKRYLSDACDYFLTQLSSVQNYLDVDPDCYACFSGVCEYDTAFFASLKSALESDSFADVRRTVMTFQKIKFPTMRAKPPEMEAYKELRSEIKDVAEDWAKRFFGFSDSEIREQMLRNAELCDMLYELFSEYATRVWEEKKRRGIMEFNDVREKLYSLLTLPNGEPTPFAEELSKHYDAVYIDEYQDVDFMQDRIFSLIGKERRFMVGDIKQSIYGFRGSEPTIFADYRKAMPLHTDISAVDSDAVCVFMSENFRCNEPIIDYANRVCAFLFSGCEESVGYRPEDDLRFSKGRDETLPSAEQVQTVIFEGYPRAKKGDAAADMQERPHRESVWVASEIEKLLRDGKLDNGELITPSDVAILVRNAKHGIPYVKALEQRGIPVAANAGNDIVHSPLMTELLNLLRCIDNPHRDLPLSEYLLSPSGGFILEELGEIRAASSDQISLYEAITASAEHEDFPAHEKCTVFLAWLEHFQKLAAAQPADRFLRLLYADPRLTPYAGSPELPVLYEQARTYQRNSWCGLYGFLKHFDKMIESGTITAGAFQKEDDAVRIMTMHTSKGLEYPVVFLCSCDKRFSTKSMDETLLFHRKLPCAARCFDPVTTNNESGILREITKLEIQAEEAEESIRLLYVALTRARERLYVTGTLDGSYDKMLATADRILCGSRYSILYQGNFLRWIISALLKKECKKGKNSCTFRYIPLSDELEQIEREETASHDQSNISFKSDGASICSDEFSLIVEQQKEFVYPLATLHGIPTKIAASKLRSDLLDSISDTDENEEGLNVQIELMSNASPAFDSLMSRKHHADAADIGTAMHSFLQFCDLSSLPSVGIETEITRLVANKFILQKTADMLNLAQLESFVKSDLMTLLQDAETVYREQIFGLPIPLSALTNLRRQDPVYREQTVLVQGSIDLLLRMKDGRLILFDYKTDYIPAEERKNEALLVRNMTQKHGDQLSCYARAVRALFGRAPDEVFIYSLSLGRSIPISVDDSKFDL